MNLLSHLKKIDWLMIASSILLGCIGLFSIYSYSLGRGDFFNFKKQIVFLAIGFLFAVVLSFFDWRAFRDNPYLILALYLCCILFLAGLFIFAPNIRGIRGWYKIGFLSFDPVEFTKIILIILLAKYFSMRHIEMYRLRHIILSGFYVLVPALLIFYQPDLGSALILIALWAGILIVSGIKLHHFLILILCGLLVLVFSWSFLLRDYQKARITSFFAPQIEPLGMNWSQQQAKIAIGSGGILGQGIGKGSQTQHGFLPEPHTDFIFASIAEEMGLIGVLVLFCLFLIIIWRALRIAALAHSNFPRLFAVGFVIILVFQTFIHIGMNLGILPVIGIPLTFVSYGGSGLIAGYIGLGILQSIRVH